MAEDQLAERNPLGIRIMDTHNRGDAGSRRVFSRLMVCLCRRDRRDRGGNCGSLWAAMALGIDYEECVLS